MGQTHDEITQHLAERWCWQVARRDDTRIARRLYRQHMVDGVYRLDEGALLDDFFRFLQELGVMAMRPETHGAGLDRVMVPFVPYLWLDGLNTRFGIERINALPTLLGSDEARMPWVGFNTPQLRDGVCQRGAAKRQGERALGPSGSDTLAKTIVQLNLRDLEVVLNGAMRAVATAGVFAAQVTGMADGTNRETTPRDAGCGHVTRQVRIEEKGGRMHEIEVTVYGWNVLLLIDAATTIPLAVKVGQIEAHEPHGTRALVTPARAHLAGAARLHNVVFDQGVLDGTARWWLNQQGLLLVVPAKAHMAVTADARAQAAAGDGITIGRRVHTVRHGPGNVARPERLATEVVGITGLTTDEHSGTVAHGR
jgi:hypothetical protein